MPCACCSSKVKGEVNSALSCIGCGTLFNPTTGQIQVGNIGAICQTCASGIASVVSKLTSK